MATNNDARDIDRVWDLMQTVGYAMLVTRDGGTLRGRPMTAYVERSDGAVYFLTDARAHKDEEIAQSPIVGLSFADIGSQKYIWIKGRAAISNDRGKIRDLFSTPARAWWDNADDPNIRALKITPEEAEFWDSPGKLVAYTKMAAAVVTGTRPEIGDNRKVAM